MTNAKHDFLIDGVKVSVTLDHGKSNARYIKPYLAYCSKHNRNCTHYECEYVLRSIDRIFDDDVIKRCTTPSELSELDWQRLRKSAALADNPGKTLDVGCGTAKYHKLLKPGTVWGTDVSEIVIRKAKENNPKNRYVRSSLAELNFESNYFDNILCLEVIEHLSVEEGKALIKEIYRCLKPGGILILSVPSRYYPPLFLGYLLGKRSPVGYSRTHMRNYTVGDLRKLLRDRFSIVSADYNNFVIPFLHKVMGVKNALAFRNRMARILPVFAQTIIVKCRKL